MNVRACLRRAAWIGSVLIGLGAGWPAQAQIFSDTERKQLELAVPATIPPLSKESDLLEFYVSPVTTNRFAIDPASLTIDQEVFALFTLVVTSARGVRNISYEAFKCSEAQRRILALGRADGTWTPVRNPVWRSIVSGDTVNNQYPELARALCTGPSATSSRQMALDKLKAAYKVPY